ncbi:hypothetical protein KHC23_12515 [Ancylobacter dichloromethanicus]|uniref:Glutelin n=1 Tax=Ancylobacter dichloromethanicus TaxID=518825 RepID=A0A9W6MZ13_9HYPH|nr:hypothetical protein [Ancylobacter dichloromethanicus]MBS7554476.1 hypothetical protein [Ancylobacter dichloromethanicus]GLK71606.1 hypothetical protein GCM10017643_17210 [Ancylobacter dichloromethanicus]
MTYAKFLPATAFVLAVAAAQPALAAGAFECPKSTLEASQAATIKAVLPTGDGLDAPDALDAAVDSLRGKGLGSGLIIDGVITAYCPGVAAQAGLSDAQKTEKLAGFASRVTRTVYSLDSADAVILDVAFPPQILNDINAKAAAAKVAPEAFVRQAVDAALK